MVPELSTRQNLTAEQTGASLKIPSSCDQNYRFWNQDLPSNKAEVETTTDSL